MSPKQSRTGAPYTVTIPANIDQPDRVAFHLTARQLAILATTGLLAWLLATTAQLLAPPLVADALALPIVAVGAALALGQRDGLGLDQLALAALRHARTPRYQVPAPEGVPAPPDLLAHLPTGPPPGPLALPAHGIDHHGLVDLGGDGMALLCQATTVNFALRTPAEQQALVAALARVLHALTGPVQLVVAAERVDLAALVRDLNQGAGGLPHPALEACARDHARFLGELARRRDVLRRAWLLVFRDPAIRDAGVRLARRAEQAATLLHAAGVQLAPLDRPRAHAVVSRALAPDTPQPAGVPAPSDQPVTHHPPPEAAPMLTRHLRLRQRARRTTTTRSEPAGRLGGLLGPDAIQVGPRWLRVGGTWCRTLAVTGYPHQVPLGWLEPVLSAPGTLDIALHVEPIPPLVAAERLRRQLARLESTRRLDTDTGRLPDFGAEAAADDAAELARRLARGQGRLFRAGLYLTIRAPSQAELDAHTDAVRALLGSLLLTTHPATFRTLQGWATTLPLGVDALRLRRTFDTEALAAAFPFASAELPHTGGVLYGRNLNSQGLVFWDRFAQRNYNSVLLAPSGAGKSYLAKLEALRWLYQGVQVLVVDPEREYQRLADAVGGTSLRLGAPGVRLNPFDLPQPTGTPADREALTRRALFLHTLIAVLLGQPPAPEEAAALDRAILAAYKAKGISADPRTHPRPAPLLRDLAAALARDAHPGATTLAARLEPFTIGSHRGLFDGPTSVRPEGHLVVFSLRELPDELAGVGTLLTLDAIWRQVTSTTQRRRRLVLVDEAWLLIRDPVGARYLYRLAKSARKHWTGLTVATQDPADLLASDLGQALVANAATQVLLGQAPQTIEQVAAAFRLSEGERAYLLAARPGQSLLLAGQHRVAFESLASPAEHPHVTTDPAELADLDDQQVTP